MLVLEDCEANGHNENGMHANILSKFVILLVVISQRYEVWSVVKERMKLSENISRIQKYRRRQAKTDRHN